MTLEKQQWKTCFLQEVTGVNHQGHEHWALKKDQGIHMSKRTGKRSRDFPYGHDESVFFFLNGLLHDEL